MWTKLAAITLLSAGVMCCIAGCSRAKRQAAVWPYSGRGGVVDRDFVATVSPTNDPHAFIVKAEKVNWKPRKWIIPGPSLVSCILRDSAGREWDALSDPNPRFELHVGVGQENPEGPANQITTRITVTNVSLPPGAYTLVPIVRIAEGGPDMLQDPKAENLTVEVPVKNSLKITLK